MWQTFAPFSLTAEEKHYHAGMKWQEAEASLVIRYKNVFIHIYLAHDNEKFRGGTLKFNFHDIKIFYYQIKMRL